MPNRPPRFGTDASVLVNLAVALRLTDVVPIDVVRGCTTATSRSPAHPAPVRAGLLGALGRYAESAPLWDGYLARWPHVEALAGEAIADAANAGDWARLDSLVEKCRSHGTLSSQLQAFVDVQRARCAPRQDALQAQRKRIAARFARDGRIALGDLAQLVAGGAADEAFDIVERASFAHLFDRGARVWPGVWAPAVIFVEANRAMIRDRRFPRLCARLGLVDYWAGTGRWPDCADDPELAYDFRNACAEVASR